MNLVSVGTKLLDSVLLSAKMHKAFSMVFYLLIKYCDVLWINLQALLMLLLFMK
jgi:hypothetical protein